MWKSLEEFYKSKQWEKFIAALKQERVNDEGFIICAHCGEPIVKKYDCIGHHIEELTLENVNDYTISLNPDNVELIHFKCHNKAHKRFGYGNAHRKPAPTQEVYIVYGSPCSGKTTFVRESAGENDIILDIDNIYECITANERYIKPERIRENAFGIRDCILDMIKCRRGKWFTAWVIGGYPLLMERTRLETALGAKSIFIDTDKETCLNRARDRPKEYQQYIEDWWNKFQPSPTE